jgi:hypothetical protein
VRRAAAGAAAATVALVVAVALAGSDRGLAVYAYVLLLGAIALAVLSARLRRLPATAPLEELLPPGGEPGDDRRQLDVVVRRLVGGESSAFELHHQLRPLVQQIASARLARGHGVDLERMPERARALVGARTWELVRPEREPPSERFLAGWPVAELEALVDELEAI